MSVRVVARIRPLLKLEIEKDVIVNAESVGNEAPGSPTVVRIPNPKNESESYTFQFNSVYEQHATQQDIFDHEVAPTVKHLFNGFDTTIFAYGVTGTGKTHTMRGGKSLADRGVIPRLLSAIYRRSRKVEKDTAGATQVEVAMSYYEIYNDKVYDLFEPPEKRTAAGLPIRDNNGKTVVVGLTERPCTSLKEFEQLYDQANVNRSTSATKLNAHSSRSHAILCVKLTQTTDTTVRVSRACAIDLAGSEDNRRTDNNKERLVESSSINKSLFVLAQCVEAISKKQARIPYRESKMTRILSLGQNNGLTIMILNLAPVRNYHLDTLSSLNFANRTKKIEVSEVENEPMFRGDTKPSITSSIAGRNMQRQPLRPLASAHNVNINHVPQKSEKPLKEFTVYSDARKPQRPSGTSNGVRRSNEPQKRRAEASVQARPSKVVRPNVTRPYPSAPGLSAADIERMIDAKLSSAFAERALDSNAISAMPALPPELQKRLDDLEKRVENSADKSKEEGLHFLMMAKQHQARGEDASALKMYKLAVPYFPSNERLEKKITALEEKIYGKKVEPLTNDNIFRATTFSTSDPVTSDPFVTQQPLAPSRPSQTVSLPPPPRALAAPAKRSLAKQKPKPLPESDDADGSCFIPEAASDPESDAGYASDTSFRFQKRSSAPARPKKRSTLTVHRDLPTAASTAPAPAPAQQQHSSSDPLQHHSSPHKHSVTPPTPRTHQLLAIINSRDAAQIRALRGVGAKRAEAIVNCLIEMDAEAVTDLQTLAGIKGVGVKLVENMRAGLGELDL